MARLASADVTFLFLVADLDDETDVSTRVFDVIDFEGEEAISQLFSFQITLEADTADVTFSEVVNQAADLYLQPTIESVVITEAVIEGGVEVTPSEEGDQVTDQVRKVSGIVTDFQLLGESGIGVYQYQLTMVPKHWRYTLNYQSRVFQDKSVKQIVEKVFELGTDANDNALVAPGDYDFSDEIDNPEPKLREYCVQYRETDFNFISRLMEYEGMYYFFDFDDGKMVVIDSQMDSSNAVLEPNIGGAAAAVSVAYSTTAGMNIGDLAYISRFRYREKLVAGKVRLQDRDFENPTNNRLSDEQVVDSALPGLYHDFGQTFADTAEGNALAAIRKQEIDCMRRVAQGTGNEMAFSSGHRFDLSGHPGTALNRTYLLTRVLHLGAQAGLLGYSESPVMRKYGYQDTGGGYVSNGYVNEFTCIPTSAPGTEVAIQYRPPRTTPVPVVSGILTAPIEATPEHFEDSDPESTSIEAHIDEDGRYKIKMPFDGRTTIDEADSSNPDAALRGDATRPVPMAQPYSGGNYGIHFPNHNGTEMVFACLNGDVDRPVALGTVPNTQNHTPVPNTDDTLGKLPTQNAVGNSPIGAISGDAVTFEPTKNVIQTRLGHRLVMDDGPATGNIGITLQVGHWANPDSPINIDAYWNSRIDMGGYRTKTITEQVLDSLSYIITWITPFLSSWATSPNKSAMATEYVAILAEFTATHLAAGLETGNPIDDQMYGSTTPVGVAINTDKGIGIMGQDGVSIVSPNIFGIFGGGMIPGIDSQGQHRLAWAIVNFLGGAIDEDIVSTAADIRDRNDEDTETVKRFKDHKAREKTKSKSYFRRLLLAILRRTGVNLKSAESIGLSAFGKVGIKAGYGGIDMNSVATIKQSASQDINVESAQGITIRAEGKPRPFSDSKVGSALDSLFGAIGLTNIMGEAFGEDDEVEESDLKLTLRNENQDIQLLTDKRHIVQMAKEGNLKALSLDGRIYQRAKKSARIEVGEIDPETEEITDENKKAFLYLTESFDGYGRLSAKDAVILDAGEEADTYYVIVSKGDQKVTIQAGDAFIEMDGASGNITLSGAEVNITGDTVNIEASQNLLLAGVSGLDMYGMNVNINGQVAANIKSATGKWEGSLIELGPGAAAESHQVQPGQAPNVASEDEEEEEEL